MADRNPTWPEIKADIERRLRAVQAKLVRARTIEEVWLLQGKGQQLEELLNLPATVEILDQKGA